jgi:hypothetical protein
MAAVHPDEFLACVVAGFDAEYACRRAGELNAEFLTNFPQRTGVIVFA